MKTVDEIYKEWCGASRLENSVRLVHDSTEAIEFALYYYDEMKPVQVVELDTSNLFEAGMVQCDLCGYKWSACRPYGVDELQCPNCRNTSLVKNLPE